MVTPPSEARVRSPAAVPGWPASSAAHSRQRGGKRKTGNPAPDSGGHYRRPTVGVVDMDQERARLAHRAPNRSHSPGSGRTDMARAAQQHTMSSPAGWSRPDSDPRAVREVQPGAPGRHLGPWHGPDSESDSGSQPAEARPCTYAAHGTGRRRSGTRAGRATRKTRRGYGPIKRTPTPATATTGHAASRTGGETRQYPNGLTRPRMPAPGPGCEPEGTGLGREKGSRITWRAMQSNEVERSAARGLRPGALGAGRSEYYQRPVGSSRRADRVRSAMVRGRRPGRRRPRVWRRWGQSRSGRRRPFDADMSPEPA